MIRFSDPCTVFGAEGLAMIKWIWSDPVLYETPEIRHRDANKGEGRILFVVSPGLENLQRPDIRHETPLTNGGAWKGKHPDTDRPTMELNPCHPQ